LDQGLICVRRPIRIIQFRFIGEVMKIIVLVLTLGAAALLVGGCASSSAPKPASALPLAGTSWRLVELEGQPVPATEGLRTPTLQLDSASRRAAGTSGINRYTAGYEVSGSAMKFATGASTRMAGPAAAMAVEDAYLKALASVSSWSVTGNQLELKSADRTVLRFQAP
jgi:heat shock protein HslJ